MEKGDDPWEILGVPRDASEADIKKAFRKAALKFHPDKQTTEEDKLAAHDIFARLSSAYDTLSDPVKRYDWKQAEEARAAKAAPKPSPRPAPHKQPTPRGQPTKASVAGTPQTRPSTSAAPTQRSSPPGQKTAGSHPKQPERKGSFTPPAPSKRVSAPPPPPQRVFNKAKAAAASPKRQSVDVTGKFKKPSAQKRVSEPPPSTMGWQRQVPTKAGPPKPQVRKYRDPFDIFESVMKEEYGENYKDKDESGWKGSIGVPGLAKINPFRRQSESSTKEFKKLDINNDKTLSRDELGKYIESHSDLWTTLGLNLNLPVKKCVEIATNVAFALACGEGKNKPKKSEAGKRRELSEAEFKYFHKNYVLEEKGSHEFFLRTIFSVFDLNNDGVLNARELDKFLDIFYKAKDVFKGDMKLPEKKHLLKIVGSRLDANRDGVLAFEEVRDLLEVAAVVSTEK